MLDRLTLDQLRVLIAVAESGSFSAAARRLGRVQSAISQSMQTLESALGTPLFERDGKVPRLSDAGKAVLEDARHLVRSAETLKARAESMAADTEPHLTLAVDAIFPNQVLMMSLRDLTKEFPCMPVTLFTEGLGGPEQRLRDGVARLGIYTAIYGESADFESEFLVSVPLVPVAAASHPLAREQGPLPREALERHVQLVLTDRTTVSAGMSGGVISPRIWRFADQHTRLEFLLGGFGWCNMPYHAVREHIDAGRLAALNLIGSTMKSLPLSVVHERGRPPGKAGRWLIDDLRGRLSACVGKFPGLVDLGNRNEAAA
jgi:DNA-binding transcriptional LysR family regulator